MTQRRQIQRRQCQRNLLRHDFSNPTAFATINRFTKVTIRLKVNNRNINHRIRRPQESRTTATPRFNSITGIRIRTLIFQRVDTKFNLRGIRTFNRNLRRTMLSTIISRLRRIAQANQADIGMTTLNAIIVKLTILNAQSIARTQHRTFRR